MTGNDYQMLAARTINKELRNDEKVLHALHGISSKLGEIHGIYQKAYHGHDLDTAHIIHIMGELGDLMWFVAELCTANGWTLERRGANLRANCLSDVDGCKGCNHLDPDLNCCIYILNTGHSRGCPPGEGCLRHSSRDVDAPPDAVVFANERVFAAVNARSREIVHGPSTIEELSHWAGMKRFILFEYIRNRTVKRKGVAGGCRFELLQEEIDKLGTPSLPNRRLFTTKKDTASDLLL